MTKHNKKYYQREVKKRPIIECTGNAYLQYAHEDEIGSAIKGDLKLHPSVEALHTIRQGDYWSTGNAGYFRVDVYDGREWRPVVLDELFPDREHHFRKTECPIDTFNLCAELLAAYAGKQLIRTYREHYEVLTNDTADSDE
jgi:hypothetical protein